MKLLAGFKATVLAPDQGVVRDDECDPARGIEGACVRHWDRVSFSTESNAKVDDRVMRSDHLSGDRPAGSFWWSHVAKLEAIGKATEQLLDRRVADMDARLSSPQPPKAR